MAVAPPLTLNLGLEQNWRDVPCQFGRYNRTGEKSSPPQPQEPARQASSFSLEALAALIQPESLVSPFSPFHEEPTPCRPALYEFQKSKSFPTATGQPLRSSLHHLTLPRVQRSRSVRFADTQGLPLESVRKLTAADPFETEGEIVPYGSDLGKPSVRRSASSPQAPSTAPNHPADSQQKSPVRKLKFSQPGTQPDFYSRIHQQKICLESIKCETRALHGVVRVLNLCYEKEVMVRWTHDHWASCHDSVCTYCHGSGDGHTDRFAFTLPLNGDDVEFAVCFRLQGQEYWDNNNGQNYLICVDV